MLNHAKANKEHVDTFMYEIGSQECNLTKHMKINFLQLLMAEWTCAGQFVDLLSAWSLHAERSKYLRFATSLQAVAMKVDKYYEKMMKLPAYIMAMLLDPVGKMVYFKWHWPEDLHDEVLTTAEKVVHQPNFNFMHSLHPRKVKWAASSLSFEKSSVIHANPTLASIGNPLRPWRAEVMSYIETIEATLPAGMTIIQWWGLEELDDVELEAGSDSKTAGDDGDDKDSWDIMLDDAEDNADDEADDEVSDFETD
ncbi:hypothetical protein BDR07DRAFT_1386545 [Suillus spraguei]|nr:hypothetical protein BDR07DRAFT_1386545 [Suillus spraguei]